MYTDVDRYDCLCCVQGTYATHALYVRALDEGVSGIVCAECVALHFLGLDDASGFLMRFLTDTCPFPEARTIGPYYFRHTGRGVVDTTVTQ